jgi:hypothetical protein
MKAGGINNLDDELVDGKSRTVGHEGSHVHASNLFVLDDVPSLDLEELERLKW